MRCSGFLLYWAKIACILSQVDDLTDLLLDCGLNAEEVALVQAQMQRTIRAEAQAAGGMIVVRVLDWLLGGHSDANLRLRAYALAWAADLGHLTGLEHWGDTAYHLGVSRQAVADSVKRAKVALFGVGI